MTTLLPTATPHSTTWTYFEGAWREGNIPLMGPRTHAAWMASSVFDGARVFEGVAPDLDKHFQRVNRSAEAFGLKSSVALELWMALAAEGIARFDPGAALYVRPMYWPDSGFGGGVMFDPDSTRWCLCLYEAPMPEPRGVAITLSPFRRPTAETALVEAKAGALYPNGARALAEAAARGFGNCVMRDALGDVAELANANLVFVRDGTAITPQPNGTFLDGITRRRVTGLLRDEGVEVREIRVRWQDLLGADEIFSCGNFNKVAPVTRIEGRELPIGPIYRQARSLYWKFAHAGAADLQALARAAA